MLRKLLILLPVLAMIPILSMAAEEDKYRLNPTPDPNAPFGFYIPKDLNDALSELQKMLHPDLVEEITHGSESDMIKYHFGLGMWIRNNWALWKGSRISRYFNELEIYHPDDMSGIILDSFWTQLNGKPIGLEAQIGKYKTYWEKEKQQ